MELVDAVSASLGHADDALRLTTTVGTVLGSDWPDYSTARFDDVLAASSVRFYRADAVPRVEPPVPNGVTQIEFVSDLSDVAKLSDSDLAAAGGLWSAIRPTFHTP